MSRQYPSKEVVRHIFAFLPTQDLLNCRFVNKEWNSLAKPFLEERVIIHFNFNLHPQTFLEQFKGSCPHSVVTNFKFSRFDNKRWRKCEIGQLFRDLGVNIKRITFDSILLEEDDSPVRYFRNVDVTDWLNKAPNLIELTIKQQIENDLAEMFTLLKVELYQLKTLKSIYLTRCDILYPINTIENLKISPDEIFLFDVQFQRGESILKDVVVNDYIDCDNASIVILCANNNNSSFIRFYMSVHNLPTLQHYLLHPEVQKLIQPIAEFQKSVSKGPFYVWKESPNEIDTLTLNGPDLLTTIPLKIKRLNCINSKVCLTFLPQTITQLFLSEHAKIFFHADVEIVNLLNLKVLTFDVNLDLRKIVAFASCPNLTKLVLIESAQKLLYTTIDLNWVPRSVQTVKIINVIVEFVGQNCNVLELDKLILENYLQYIHNDVGIILERVKPKFLVVSNWDVKELTLNNVSQFVFQNSQVENVIVGSDDDYDLNWTSKSTTCNYVGEKSNYYTFGKCGGKCITKKEFEEWREMDQHLGFEGQLIYPVPRVQLNEIETVL